MAKDPSGLRRGLVKGAVVITALLLAGTAAADIIVNANDTNGAWDFGVTEAPDAGSPNGLLNGIPRHRHRTASGQEDGATGRNQEDADQPSARINPGDSLYVRAHGTCRRIANQDSRGAFAPLRSQAEWEQMIAEAPGSVSRTPCCGPAKVDVCGVQYLGWHDAGTQEFVSGGYSRVSVFECGADGNYTEISATGLCTPSVTPPTGDGGDGGSNGGDGGDGSGSGGGCGGDSGGSGGSCGGGGDGF